MATADRPIQIDFVSDVVCPWCAIGFHQLVRAQQTNGIESEIRLRPFELNPEMPPEGQGLFENSRNKYGISASETQRKLDSLTAIGKATGLEFRFTDDMCISNTFLSHQLLRWAGKQGRPLRLMTALYTAHFRLHQNLSEIGVLTSLAENVGLDRRAAEEMLVSQRHAATVRADEAYWRNLGGHGLPVIIIEKRHSVTGALGSETFGLMLRQANAELSLAT